MGSFSVIDLTQHSMLLPLVIDLMSDKFESYIVVAVQVARAILATNSVLMGRYVRQVCKNVNAILGYIAL